MNDAIIFRHECNNTCICFYLQVTKQWNGLIKELLDEKADMVVSSFIIDEMRLGAIDFSTPYLESGVTIMVSIRKGAISPYAFLGKGKIIFTAINSSLVNKMSTISSQQYFGYNKSPTS